ncbi:MAG TPA: NAD-binding protein [Solirubrobacteraceae bacterium]|nr:NAD-binding protein [Solirubrobacteraceae bacterium]
MAAEETVPPPGAESCRDWAGHVIVCGLNDVALRTVEQLHLAGARTVVLSDEPDERLIRIVRGWGIPHLPRGGHLSEPLFEAGISGAEAVVCAESTDLRTLETVLQIRDLRQDVRVVADLDNPSVAHAVEGVLHSVGVLDVAALFAPAVVETCLGARAREIELGETTFVAAEVLAPREGTLRELYGSLAPIGVVAEADDEVIACPGRDQRVSARDRVTLLGTSAELEAAGLRPRHSSAGAASELSARMRSFLKRTTGALAGIVDRPLRIALLLGLVLLIVSTLVLHFGYHEALGRTHLSVLDSVYFTVETVATVGFGDFSFAAQPTGMVAFGIFLIVAGVTLTTTMFALLTNALVSRRLAQSLGHGRIPGMRGHVVLVGLGSVGMKVLEGLLRAGAEVVVIERMENNPYLTEARALQAPIVLGDATLARTLEAANLSEAAAVAILTSDDLTNIETGLAIRDHLEERWGEVPVVLRVFDRQLGHRLEQSFGFRHVWSTSAIAAPWFVGGALGLDVLFTFYVGSHPFLLARLRVSAGGGLDGLAMRELPGTVRVVAIRRAAGASSTAREAAPAHLAGAPDEAGSVGAPSALEHPPRRDTRLAPDDDAYLVGPYAELLEVLRHDREPAVST